MRALLDEADAVDYRHAIVAPRDALRARGAEAEVHGLTISSKTCAGILRTVTARRGTFAWATGVNVGPVRDSQAATARITRGLGLETVR